tara:strand:- start:282 stop:875 length:594 start_codon:yes stop_codon:yes gene_type:complete
MRSLYDFIISPVRGRYNNTKSVGKKELILNTKIETFQSVNKEATVISTPIAYDTGVKVGDRVYVHHNVFRRFYDVKGREKNSRSYFKDNMYFCDPTQIYMYNNKAHLDYCFVSPVHNKDYLSNDKEQLHFGILKYTNDSLEALKIRPGELITFTPNSEFEFVINGEKLYCMKSNNIAITYGYKENEKEYNPSWAVSS